jgi:D-glycero-alpha-D-manno-heptose-7-phosphate kinase
VWWELDRRLVLVFLGRAHVSSEVHDRVIAGLHRDGEGSLHLEELRRAAARARDAVRAADLPALGRAMKNNTDAQGRLHASLISAEAHAVIEVAHAHGALGWKVNGAGGEGGSVTLLCGPDMRAKRRLLGALRSADPRFQVIPTHLSRSGLRVWRA